MKGLITKALAVACLAGAVAASGGCKHYRDLVDPCWPQRYAAQSRASVDETFAAQANNGHVLEQTVWTWHFEKGTDKLTMAGLEHLQQLARRRPQPDPKLYLQTAYDVVYDPAAPEKFVTTQSELNGRRVQAIQKYLGAVTAARPVNFEVAVHDPGDVGIHGAPVRAFMGKIHADIGAIRSSMPAFAGSASMTGGGGGGTGGSSR